MSNSWPPSLLGDHQAVPCVDGTTRPYVNLDHAASTPALGRVWEAVERFTPRYGSVHRGAGYVSQVATAAYEDARGSVARFVGARADDVVVFVRNTTEAINVVAAALPPGTRVVSSPVEHHANMLPWRRHDLRLLPFPRSADELVDAAERLLRERPADLLAVTGASNVTGEVWPIGELADVAHAHGAEILVDAAQLAPHRAIDMRRLGIDYLALSGHKLYAPFGAGALVARPDRLRAGTPLLHGGGAIDFVTLDDVAWAGLPDRYEAGSPNVVGAVALAAACDALLALGMDRVAARERELAERLSRRLADVPRLDLLRLWPDDADRLGVATFNLGGLRHSLVAAALSAEHGIGVRDGCFCAHPLVTHLLGIGEAEAAAIRAGVARGDRTRVPGAVRASIGLGTTAADVDALVDALHVLVRRGPAARYAYDPVRDEHRAAA